MRSSRTPEVDLEVEIQTTVPCRFSENDACNHIRIHFCIHFRRVMRPHSPYGAT
jgi:hypothetical protein